MAAPVYWLVIAKTVVNCWPSASSPNHLLRHWIEESDDSLRVGRDHGISDAGQGGVKQIAKLYRVPLAGLQRPDELFMLRRCACHG